MRIQRLEKQSNAHTTSHRCTGRAFTMVEVVVATALLGITMIAVFGAMRTCSRASHHARMLTKSVLLAETLVCETVQSGDVVFETKQGQESLYRWKVRIVPTPVENLGAIHVQVTWREQQREQQYELLSLVHMKSFVERKD